MKKGREDIYESIDKEELLKNENVSESKVQSSKTKYNQFEEPPKEYKKAVKEMDEDDVVSKMFFLESQNYYLEQSLEEMTEKLKQINKENEKD